MGDFSPNGPGVPGVKGFDGHLELVSTMSRDFAVAQDIEETLRRALIRIADYLGAEGGALFLRDEESGRLGCRVCVGPVDITGLVLDAGEGIVGRAVETNTGEIVRDVSADPNFKATVDEQSGFTTRSILCAPMSVQETRFGAIEMVNKRSGDGLFSDADLHMLSSLSTAAALALLNAKMAAALVEQERVRRELELAAEIQRSLLPPAPPDHSPIQGINRAARTVSGDFYDFFTLPDGRVCFAIGDVSGKGMDAALLMAKTCSLFHCLGKSQPEPGRLLARINAEICETATRGRFVTMAIGVHDPAEGTVRLSNAGHEPPLHFRAATGYVGYPATAPPLGIAADLVGEDGFPEEVIDLDGGALYLFTDGVTEGRLADGSMLEVEGLKALLTETAAMPLADRLNAVAERFGSGGTELRDDVTIIGIENRGRPA